MILQAQLWNLSPRATLNHLEWRHVQRTSASEAYRVTKLCKLGSLAGFSQDLLQRDFTAQFAGSVGELLSRKIEGTATTTLGSSPISRSNMIHPKPSVCSKPVAKFQRFKHMDQQHPKQSNDKKRWGLLLDPWSISVHGASGPQLHQPRPVDSPQTGCHRLHPQEKERRQVLMRHALSTGQNTNCSFDWNYSQNLWTWDYFACSAVFESG